MLTLRITGGSFNSRTDQPNSIVVTDVKEYRVYNKEYMLRLMISDISHDENTGEPIITFDTDITGFSNDGSPNELLNLALTEATPLILREWRAKAEKVIHEYFSARYLEELYNLTSGLSSSDNMTEEQYKAYDTLLWLGATSLKYIVVTFPNGEEKGYYTRQIDPVYVMNESGKTIDKV